MVDSESKRYSLVDADFLHAGGDLEAIASGEYVYVTEPPHELPTDRPNVPDLAESITRAANGDSGYFTTREIRLWAAHMSLPSVLFLHNELTAAGEPYVILQSDQNVSSLPDKNAFLQENAEVIGRGLGTEIEQQAVPLRTVTLTLPEVRSETDGTVQKFPRHVLYSRPSDVRELVLPADKRRINMHFGDPPNQRLLINPAEYNTYRRLLMKPGVVNPFIPLDDTYRNMIGETDGLAAVYYSPSPGRAAEVAISPFDSMVMSGPALDKIVRRRGRLMNAESGWMKFRPIPG
jgi:hypothetical protein